MWEINTDTTYYMQAGRHSDANFLMYKTNAPYLKVKQRIQVPRGAGNENQRLLKTIEGDQQLSPMLPSR